MFTPLNSMLPVYYIKEIGARCEYLDYLIFLLMDFLGETKAAGFTLTAFILFIAATALPTISMQIRRLRDANFNVAWIVLKATPLLVVLWVMYAFPTRDSK